MIFLQSLGKDLFPSNHSGWKETRWVHGNCTVSEGEQISLVVVQMDEEIYDIVEKQLTILLITNFLLKISTHLFEAWEIQTKRGSKFLDSSTTVKNIEGTVGELKEYIKGGNKTIREFLGFIGKPEARKVVTYLQKIIDDASSTTMTEDQEDERSI